MSADSDYPVPNTALRFGWRWRQLAHRSRRIIAGHAANDNIVAAYRAADLEGPAESWKLGGPDDYVDGGSGRNVGTSPRSLLGDHAGRVGARHHLGLGRQSAGLDLASRRTPAQTEDVRHADGCNG